MTFLVHITRLLLAAVLGVACSGKIIEWHKFEEAVGNFGIARIFVGPVAGLVAIAEGVAFGLLVFSRTASTGAASAEVLFLVFFFATVLNLSLGRRPECSCFGSIRSGPITWRTAFRSAGLAVLASVVFERSRTAQIVGFSHDRLALVGLGLGFALLAFSAPIFRIPVRFGSGDAVESIVPTPDFEGLPVGTLAPQFDVRLADGRHLDLGETVQRRGPMLILFIAARCASCSKVLSELKGARSGQQGSLSVLIVSRGDPAEIERMATGVGLGVVLQKDREIEVAYHVTATPSAVRIESNGRIGSNLAIGPIGINELLGRITSTEPQLHHPDSPVAITSIPK